jgi:hypothetical protein
MMAHFYHRAKAGVPAEQCYQRMLLLQPRVAATYTTSRSCVDFAKFSKAREITLQGLELSPTRRC